MRKPSATRDRILGLAQTLLNRDNSAALTTRRLAEAAGINEGNLYYHFRTKEALFAALLDRFEAEAAAVLRPEPGTEGLAAWTGVLRRWCALTWDWRFLFRDGAAMQVEIPALRRRLRRLSARLFAESGTALRAMEAQGLLRLPPDQRDHFPANLAIVSTYWVSFLGLRQGPRALQPGHAEWGFSQMRALFEPFLVPPH